MKHFFSEWYYRLTISMPFVSWFVVALLLGASAFFFKDFQLDASADSLVLENDKDLKYYRALRARYGSDDFLIVTYSPTGDLFSDAVLADIKLLRDRLADLQRVASVTTILDVPLIDSPRVTLAELRRFTRTLEDDSTDRALARKEFESSPLYRNLLMSPDARTTALLVNFKRDEQYEKLLKKREDLREKQLHDSLSDEEQYQLAQATLDFKRYTVKTQAQQQSDIAEVRAILDRHRAMARIHLGGVPMITSDMIDFVRDDIRTFGVGVALFLIALLGIAFRRLRWVLVPMLICTSAVVVMVGLLGLAEWRVTVVSSNFISLLLIITLSLTIHLVVRHLELSSENPSAAQPWLLQETLRTKVVPSFYTALTTMVAFGSLVVSDIRPVIDFGWMMVFGVGIAFVLSFLLFPSALAMLKAGKAVSFGHDPTSALTRILAQVIERHGRAVLLLYLLIVILSVIGISRLSVENRFIDYFKESTEISQGMVLIDQQLGGTTPLDVILDPDQDFFEYLAEERRLANASGEADDFDSLPGEGGISADSFWFNIFELETVQLVHDYLESLPETGKVLSLATTMDLLTQINGDEPLDNFALSVMHKRLPTDIKETLFNPYMSADGNQVRFGIRVIDSDINLKRDALLKKIQSDLSEKLKLQPEQVKLSGMLVLYNNVLQSLFQSQILTLSAVFVAIMVMFLILFRSIKIALIGVVPTVVAAGLILGLMGWLGIPLDIMTITIAAITIGIGVDDTIHYVHRFREEVKVDGNYWAAVHRSHGSVGRAIYYTSVTITLGFSILVLSNFIPSINFGLLTGFAMVIALIANLTLLPLLIVRFKPLGTGNA